MPSDPADGSDSSGARMIGGDPNGIALSSTRSSIPGEPPAPPPTPIPIGAISNGSGAELANQTDPESERDLGRNPIVNVRRNPHCHVGRARGPLVRRSLRY